jgi:opacity protein-like surface antigen
LLHQVYPGGPSGIDIVDDASANYLATVRPRLGYATGSALIYVTGGLAVTTLQQSHSAKEFGFSAAGTCHPNPPGGNYCNNPVSASDTIYV